MKINKWVLMIVVGVIILVGSMLARDLGKAHAEAALQRLQFVWPDVMTMPERDRALLATLGFTCSLREVELDREMIIQCLQSALLEEPTLPKGMTMDQAAKRLAELIEDSKSNEGVAK
ncbi:hypothetical protein LJR168_003914 [Pseudoxanthomonas sp. LjRoot168]|uniref:hypothetical protein n=1 Tax=unclassified Pseudoxanthomonas TaxID=2645906 RepID=UPI003ED151E6